MKCVICGKEITGYGNNAQPVCDGECCDECNIKIVLPERIRIYQESLNNGKL